MAKKPAKPKVPKPVRVGKKVAKLAGRKLRAGNKAEKALAGDVLRHMRRT